MKRKEREDFLLNEIKTREVLTAKEFYNIVRNKGIVEITARRDLQNFEKSSLVEINFGAIRYIGNNKHEKTRWEKKNLNADLKRAIARKALAYLEPNEIIFVNPGTTNEWFVRHINIPVRQLVTNGLEIFNIARNNDYIENITLIGGNYRPESTAFVGHDALNVLDRHKFSKGFFTGTNITEEFDIYNNNEAETDILLKAFKNSQVKIGLFDESKFTNQGYSYVMPLSNLDILVTNKKVKQNKNYTKKLKEQTTVEFV